MMFPICLATIADVRNLSGYDILVFLSNQHVHELIPERSTKMNNVESLGNLNVALPIDLHLIPSNYFFHSRRT